MGMQGGWASWMVTAGGGGRRIKQRWRALDCGLLGVMLGICRRDVRSSGVFIAQPVQQGLAILANEKG